MNWGEAVQLYVALKVVYGCISFGCISFLGRSGLNNRKLLSHSSGGQKSENKVLARLVLSESFDEEYSMPLVSGVKKIPRVPWLQLHTFSLCLHHHSALSLYLCPNLPYFIRTPVVLY